MSNRSPHRAWLVDLDGTLYRLFPVQVAMGITVLARAPHQWVALRAFRRQHERLRAEGAAHAPFPWHVQLERTAAELGTTVPKLEACVRTWMLHRPGPFLRLARRKALLGEIAAFRARGGRTALVSDYPARAKLEALGAHNLFDEVVANGEPGGPARLKPAPDGYLLAAGRLGVQAAECLVLGDRPDADGEAARRAGMDFRHVR